MRTPWKLTDFSFGDPDEFEFPINPNTHTPPGRRGGVDWERPVAPNGQPIIWQRLDEVSEGQFGGAVMDQSFYVTLETWCQKWYPLVLTDDLNQSWNILVRELSWERLNRHTHPYRHNYTVRYVKV